jgi:hypothetical protein
MVRQFNRVNVALDAVSERASLQLVCKDARRVTAALRAADWTQVSNIYGLPTADFHVPCAVWIGAGAYIAAAAAHGSVYFFHTGTAKARDAR